MLRRANLIYFRKNVLNLTQRELAKILECSPSYVNAVEVCRKNGSIEFYEKLYNYHNYDSIWDLIKVFDIEKQTNQNNDPKKRIYPIWSYMKRRCCDENCDNYKYYGGRGIKVCDEWVNSFDEFYEWAINNGYDENAPYGKCTLDRIDVNGNYEPSNCRWVDMKTQANNRRKRVEKGEK